MNATNINQQSVKPSKVEWDEMLEELYNDKDSDSRVYWQ